LSEKNVKDKFRTDICETDRCLQTRFFHKQLRTIKMLVKEKHRKSRKSKSLGAVHLIIFLGIKPAMKQLRFYKAKQ